jgi:predicted nucleic acid-binding protein
MRALLPGGHGAATAGRKVLTRLDLIRISTGVLDDAAVLLPDDLGSLDAIHLATARRLGQDLGTIVTYDERMAEAASHLGHRVVAPR